MMSKPHQHQNLFYNWIDFDIFDIYVHCDKDIDLGLFEKHRIKNKVKTEWGYIVRAELELLKQASNSKNPYYVLLSESCIPLHSAKTIYNRIIQTNSSIFCDVKEKPWFIHQWNLNKIPDSDELKNTFIHHSTWFTLKYQHLKLIINGEHPYQQYIDNKIFDQTYFLTVLNHFKQKNIKIEDHTAAKWDISISKNAQHPVTFTQLNDTSINFLNNSKKTYLFARKFTKQCDLSQWFKNFNIKTNPVILKQLNTQNLLIKRKQNAIKRLNTISPDKLISNNIKYKAVNLPETHKNAFNGCKIQTPHGTLLSFRAGSGRSGQYLGFLDKNNNIIPSTLSKLLIPNNIDARLFYFKDQLYISTSWEIYGPRRNQMQLWKLNIVKKDDIYLNGETFDYIIENVAKFNNIQNWTGYIKPKDQKNWAPFIHNNQLYYIYSFSPHKVLKFNFKTKKIHLVKTNEVNLDKFNFPTKDIRLNTNPVLLYSGEFLSTYHYVYNKGYYSGFYTFNTDFQITKIGQPVFLPKDCDAGGSWRNNNLKVFFLQGLQIFQNQNRIEISGGHNDYQVCIFKLKLSQILNSLIPVNQNIEKIEQKASIYARIYNFFAK